MAGVTGARDCRYKTFGHRLSSPLCLRFRGDGETGSTEVLDIENDLLPALRSSRATVLRKKSWRCNSLKLHHQRNRRLWGINRTRPLHLLSFVAYDRHSLWFCSILLSMEIHSETANPERPTTNDRRPTTLAQTATLRAARLVSRRSRTRQSRSVWRTELLAENSCAK